MASIAEIMQLCRLCLVKEQVNVPIFEEQDDVRQIFLKITACLPVKVSKEDHLPKKICDGCLYKLELLYQFHNTTTNAEKQLLLWLKAAGLDRIENDTKSKEEMITVTKNQINIQTEPNNESCDSLSIDTKTYILQQQQLPYESDEFPFQEGDFDGQTTTSVDTPAITKDVEQPPSKRRRTAAPTLLQEAPDESEEETEYVAMEEIAKTEEESEDDALVEPSLIEVLNEQDEQPGPSGIGKAEAQSPAKDIFKKYERLYGLKKCVVLLGNLKKLDTKKYSLVKSRPIVDLDLDNVIDSPRTKYKCEMCGMRFKDYYLLNSHRDIHKADNESASFYYYDDISANSSNDEELISKSKTYVCKFCKIHFKNHHSYAAHSKIHKREKLLQLQEDSVQEEEQEKGPLELFCTLCTYVSHTEIDLATHFLDVHGKENNGFSCELCLLQFKKFEELLQHNISKHALLCTVCNIKFKAFEGLTTHRFMLHAVSNPTNNYSCQKCSVKFDDMSKLKLHIKAHAKSEERKNNDAKNNLTLNDKKSVVKCDLCLKEFKDAEELKIHLSTHFSIVKVVNNEKSENSLNTVEEKVFVDNLAKNIDQINQGPPNISPKFKCTSCRATFQSKRNLNFHLKHYHSSKSKSSALNKTSKVKTTTVLKNIAPATSKPSQLVPKSSEVLTTPITMPMVSTSALKFPVQTSIPLQNTIPNTNISLSSLPGSSNEPMTINQTQTKVLFLDDNRYIILPHGSIAEGGVIKIHQPIQTADRSYQNIPSYNIMPMNNFLQQPINQTIVMSNNHDNSQINLNKTFNSTNLANLHVNSSSTIKPTNIIKPLQVTEPPKKKGNPKKSDCVKKIIVKPKILINHRVTLEKPVLSKEGLGQMKTTFDNQHINLTEDNVSKSSNISQENTEAIPTKENNLTDAISSNINMQKNSTTIPVTVEEFSSSGTFPKSIILLNNKNNLNVSKENVTLCTATETNQSKEFQSDDLDSTESNLIIDENPTATNNLSMKNENTIENFKPKIFLKPISQLLENPVLEKKQEETTKSITSEQIIVYASTSNTTTSKTNVTTQKITLKTSSSSTSHSQATSVSTTTSPTTIISTNSSTINSTSSKMSPPCSSKTNSTPKTVSTKTSQPKSKQNTHKLYKCSMCNVFCKRSISKLSRHQNKFRCKVCEYSCCKLKLMDQHYEMVHKYKNRCASCDKQFPTAVDLQNHKREVHLCLKCNKCYLDINKHKQSFKCLHCDFKACNAYNLDIHYKIVHAITTRCTPCNRGFYSPESFLKHKEEIHYCSRCKTYKMDLNIHQSFCKGESPNNKTDEIEQIIELDSD